jgi:hypothetical protein
MGSRYLEISAQDARTDIDHVHQEEGFSAFYSLFRFSNKYTLRYCKIV